MATSDPPNRDIGVMLRHDLTRRSQARRATGLGEDPLAVLRGPDEVAIDIMFAVRSHPVAMQTTILRHPALRLSRGDSIVPDVDTNP